MKEKIIRILRIILFDAFKSRWAWRRVPTQWYFDYMNYLRRKRFKENPKLPNYYRVKFVKGATKQKYKKVLVISFARHTGFNFVTYLKDFDGLFLASNPQNPSFGFYLHEAPKLFAYIKKIILDNAYNKVICIGTSRSATASLISANALADKLKFVQFYSLNFASGYKL